MDVFDGLLEVSLSDNAYELECNSAESTDNAYDIAIYSTSRNARKYDYLPVGFYLDTGNHVCVLSSYFKYIDNSLHEIARPTKE